MDDLSGTLTENDPYYVEAEIALPAILTRHPISRRTSHFPLLAPVNGAKRTSVPGRHTGLDLDERDEASLSAHAFDDEIDVTMTASESPLDDSPALPDQPLLCDPLASPTQLLPCC